jgi:Domain of unknown function (DUF4115)/PilZ domain
MNRRMEPRFQVYAPAKVALLDDPDGETPGQLLDVSGAGLRLVTDAEFQEDQIVTIETDQHLILADVRNCLARGAKFGVGAERIHSAAKLALPPTTSRIERNQALVEDFHRRLGEELLKSPGHVTARPAGAAERFEASRSAPQPAATQEPVVEPPAEPASEHVAEQVVEPPALPAEPPVAAVVLPKLVPAEPAEPRSDPQEHLPFAAAPITASINVSPLPAEMEAVPIVAEAHTEPLQEEEKKAVQDTETAPQAEAKPVVPVATEIPAPVRETTPLPQVFASEREPAHTRSRLIAFFIAAALTVIAVMALSYGPFARHAPTKTSAAVSNAGDATPEGGEIAPTPQAAGSHPVNPVTVKPVPGSPVPGTSVPVNPVGAPQPAAAVPGGKPKVSMTATDRSWVTACTDGNTVFSKLFVAGSKEEFTFTSRAVIRMGSAGPLEILLNGKSVGPLGRAGEVRVIELTPAASRFITAGEPGDCTH